MVINSPSFYLGLDWISNVWLATKYIARWPDHPNHPKIKTSGPCDAEVPPLWHLAELVHPWHQRRAIPEELYPRPHWLCLSLGSEKHVAPIGPLNWTTADHPIVEKGFVGFIFSNNQPHWPKKNGWLFYITRCPNGFDHQFFRGSWLKLSHHPSSGYLHKVHQSKAKKGSKTPANLRAWRDGIKYNMGTSCYIPIL